VIKPGSNGVEPVIKMALYPQGRKKYFLY